MEDRDARMKKICRNFCVYYKPGKDEELACLGYLVTKALMAKAGGLVLTEVTGEAAEAEGMLVKTMCLHCPFHAADCDYILKSGDAVPCGGFVALKGLLRDNIIAIAEIAEAIDGLR